MTSPSSLASNRFTERFRLLACSLVLVAVAFSQRPGQVVGDTKLDLVVNPAGMLARSLHLWDPQGGFGQGLDLDEPLLGYEWLHHRLAAIADAHGVTIGLDTLHEAERVHVLPDAPTALELGMVNRVVPRDDLSESPQRMALIAPEALAATKLAINRGADAAGFRNAMQAGVDVVAPLYAAQTEVATQFRELARKEGLGAALKWRKAQFET